MPQSEMRDRSSVKLALGKQVLAELPAGGKNKAARIFTIPAAALGEDHILFLFGLPSTGVPRKRRLEAALQYLAYW